MVDELISFFAHILILVMGYATLWFIISLIIKRNDIADVAWGLGYVLLSAYLFLTQPYSHVSLVIYILVAIWGLRLSIHIYIRNKGKTEDFRYKQWREEWGANFYWRSYLQVYVLQGLLLFIISAPITFSALAGVERLSWLTVVGIIIWIFGFYWQAVGDYQLSVFLKERKSNEAIIQSGLWKYSRHPNYFGEVVMWWAIFIIILPLENSIYLIISPITINLLIRYVSGVPMLERRYDANKAFQEYKKKVPPLMPKIKL